MRRLARILLNAATVASLLLCVALLAQWPRSYHRSEALYWVRPTRAAPGFTSTHVMISSGGLTAAHRQWVPVPGARTSEDEPGLHHYTDLPWKHDVNRLGFGGGEASAGPAYGANHWVQVPLWLVATLTAAPAAVRTIKWWRRRRRSRRPPGLCPRCNYDLRATPTRCPECGQTVSAPTPSLTTPP